MGLEADCRATWGRRSAVGKARLEESEIAFRGAFSLKIPLGAVKRVEARAGRLAVEWAGSSVAFALGAASEKWAAKIRSPRSRLEKLGVKPASRVCVIGLKDGGFLEELEERTPQVTSGRVVKDADLIFFAAEARGELSRLASLRAGMRRDGAVWVLWPKGREALREDDVRSAAREVGLVDVKVVSFSEALSGLKLVIPVAQR